MMSSSRRFSKQADEWECKAAFLSMYDDIDDKIESKKSLNTLLQTSGRNPTKARLDKHWTRDTYSLSFSDFVQICGKEPVTSADDLMQAFRKIDINGDGYISLDELYKIMNRGESSMSLEEVRKMIDEVDENKDGKLDYGEIYSKSQPVIWKDRIYYDQFANMVVKTSEESRKFTQKVMERKERKKRRGEKSRNLASSSNVESNDQPLGVGRGDNIISSKHDDLGSSASLRARHKLGSNLAESDKGSKTDIHPEMGKDVSGSKLSLRSKSGDVEGKDASFAFLKSDVRETMGSKVSVMEGLMESEDSKLSSKQPDENVNSSKVSLRKSLHEMHGSKVSLRSELDDIHDSRVSVKGDTGEMQGSRASVKSTSADIRGSRVSLRSKTDIQPEIGKDVTGSKLSLRSKSGDVESKDASFAPLKSDVRETTGSKISVREGLMESGLSSKQPDQNVNGSKVSLRKNLQVMHGSKVSIKSELDDVNSSRVSLKAATGDMQGSRVSLRSESGIKGTGRSRLEKEKDKYGEGTVKGTEDEDELRTVRATSEEHGSSSAKVQQTTSEAVQLKPKLEEPQNSARTVGEEIEYDDDFDIVSTGRPTPRVDLHSSKKDTQKMEAKQTPRTDTLSKPPKKPDKGNAHAKSLDSEERVISAHAEGISTKDSHGNKSTENKALTYNKDTDNISKHTTAGKADAKQRDGDKLKQLFTEEREASVTSRTIDEIFKQSYQLDMSQRNQSTEADQVTGGTKVAKDVKNQQLEVSKDTAPPKPKPRKEQTIDDKLEKVQQPEENRDAKHGKSTSLNGEVRGSLSSLRSGDLGAPVPSPRKTLSSRLPEDDGPRPSPRVTLKKDVKGKSLSTRGRDKLPDPRTLRDWTKFMSKGCFFYEDDEIVSHVFSLNLNNDSTVFLSVEPVQELECLDLPCKEPIDTVLYMFDRLGNFVTSTEQRDVAGMYGVKIELAAGQYQVLPYTTGCRFKQRGDGQQEHQKEAKLVKKDKEGNVVITAAFRRALGDIFDLCDLDGNGTMSYSEFNWFNLRTSGEELEEDEWKVVEERITLKNDEITKKGFIELNEMEAEDVKGDTEDLWITLTSMGMNKALIMDEACPYKVEVYVEEYGRAAPTFKVTGIESLEKKEYTDEICKAILEKGEPEKVRNMKDLYICTYKNEHRSTVVVDNRSRSTVNLEVDCSKSRNVTSNRSTLDYTFEVDPQSAVIAHHLLPRNEGNDWSVNVTETIHK